MTMAAKIAAQRQILASIKLSDDQKVTSLSATAFEGKKFAQVSGGEITAAVEKVYRGGSLFPETLCAPAEIGDITLTDFSQDDNTLNGDIQALRQYVGRVYFDITVGQYDCDIQTPGTSRFYSRALLVGMTESDGDASSGAPATFAMTFSISTVSVPVQPKQSSTIVA